MNHHRMDETDTTESGLPNSANSNHSQTPTTGSNSSLELIAVSPPKGQSMVPSSRHCHRSVTNDCHDRRHPRPSLEDRGEQLEQLSDSSAALEGPAAQSTPTAAAADEPTNKLFGDKIARGKKATGKYTKYHRQLHSERRYDGRHSARYDRRQSGERYDERHPLKSAYYFDAIEASGLRYDDKRRFSEKPVCYNKRMQTLILGHVTSLIIMVAVILLLVLAGFGFLVWKLMAVTGSSVFIRNGSAITPQCWTGSAAVLNASTAVDCYDLLRLGYSISGVYKIKPNQRSNVTDVYCDMDTDGGGWTVLLRRQDNSENFVRRWADYRNGFGKLEGEFWAGNELMHQMTSGQRDYAFRVDMIRFDGFFQYAEYSEFSLAPESDFYRLYISGYSGTAGDSLLYHNACRFSTLEIDNDFSRGNCARLSGAPWWFRNCHHVFLTGPYGSYPAVDQGRGMSWRIPWATRVYLRFVEMKIRPKNTTVICA